MFQITGVLKAIGNEQTVSERFKKREFVLTDSSSQYPQHISFQLTQERCSLIEGINVGDDMTVYFNLRGREWKNPQGETKYFNSLDAWKIEKKKSSLTNSDITSPDESFPEPSIENMPIDSKDDLPF
jgi:hypothetical protein